jgi:hypothetical protein
MEKYKNAMRMMMDFKNEILDLLVNKKISEEAKFKYTELLQSRNDFQEAWLGLTISNFILGDYFIS